MNWDHKQEIVKEMEYSTGRWRMTVRDEEFFVSNMDLLLSPCGSGTTEKEAFTNMLDYIGEYEKKLEKIKTEIKEHLELLEKDSITKTGDENA